MKDTDFNLHLKMAAVSSAWLVKKPTVDGLVHSIEIFDSPGEMVVQFFGKRKPGLPAAANWRNGILQLVERFNK
ncbi:ChuX/HutX family heme-like substrate-binding protein [Flavihumibacter sp. UBA7668]|uniref:ChuX/HutX family heme-like substrate-binding protein n=1 Tax=Flavihumibacter sp. UBA7668 TaxID=1946542 RepID=UPI0025BC4E6E|nr:ChuX/HutX family heme-like substrate-binding protein [Flavihumibacter sp. UBA7668]